MKKMSHQQECMAEKLLKSTDDIINRRTFIDRELYDSLILRYENLTDKFYIINWIREQGEDIYVIVVGGNEIVEIELSRVDSTCNPIRVEVTGLNEYLKTHPLVKNTRRKLDIAIRLTKME